MRIGQLAAAAEVSVDAIRYYERLGLLPRPQRTASGYRQYPADVVTRVLLIRNAVRFGFPLKDVARFLTVRDAGGAPCRQVSEYAQQLLRQMDERIHELEAVRRSMALTLREWDAKLAETRPDTRAHLLESLSSFIPRESMPRDRGARRVERMAARRRPRSR